MTERFVSPCPPPTPAEAELLDLLIEEAAEVIQRATKMKRFGVLEVEPGQPLSNMARLSHEIGDFSAVMARCADAGLVAEVLVLSGALAKEEKLHRYLQHQPTGDAA